MSMKNLYIVNSLTLIIFCVVCAACNNQSATPPAIRPVLISALLQPSDFSSQWDWRDVPTSDPDNPLWVDKLKFEGNEIIERKSRRLTGVYAEKYSVEVFHLVIQWKQPVIEDTLKSLRPELVAPNIPISISKFGTYTRSKCVTDIDPDIHNATCHTIVAYSNVTSVFDIFVISDIEIEPQILETMLNEGLTSMNRRIEKIDR